MEISSELITKLLDLLRPFLEDEGERKAYLLLALGTARDRLNLTWKQPANTFIPELLKELLDFGEISRGQPALCAFLEVIREYVGEDVKVDLDELNQKIREELQKAEITGNSFQTTDALIEQVEQYLYDPNRYIFLNKLLLQESKALAEVMQGELEACPWVLSIDNKQQCQQCIEYLEAKSERFVRILATIIHHDQNAQFITPVAKALKALAREPVPINTTWTHESRWVRLYPLALAIYTVFIVGVQEEREQLLRTVLRTPLKRQAASLSDLPNLPIVYVLSYLDRYSGSIFNAVLGGPRYFVPVAERIKKILLPWLEELLLDADAAFYQSEFVLGLANIETPYYLSDEKRLSLKGLYLYYPQADPILKAFLCDSSQWLVSLYPSLEDLLDIFDTTASKLDTSGFGRMDGFCSGAVAAFRGEV
jgi:hypothetical protein